MVSTSEYLIKRSLTWAHKKCSLWLASYSQKRLVKMVTICVFPPLIQDVELYSIDQISHDTWVTQSIRVCFGYGMKYANMIVKNANLPLQKARMWNITHVSLILGCKRRYRLRFTISFHCCANSLKPPAPDALASTTSLGSLCAEYCGELKLYAAGSSCSTSRSSGS